MEPDPICCEIAHLAHHAAAEPDLWDEVVAELRRLMRAEAVGIVEHDFAGRRGKVAHAAGVGQRFCALYRAQFALLNPWLGALRRHGEGETFTGPELLPNWELVRTPFYREWLRPQGMFHGLIGLVDGCGERVSCVIALRSLDAPPFESADKAGLAALLPRLRCARRLSAEFSAARQTVEIVLDVLAALPEAAIVVNAEASPIIVNRAAEELLSARDGLMLTNGGVSSASSETAVSLRRAIATACSSEAGGGAEIVIERSPGTPPLLVHVVPLPHLAGDETGRWRRVAVLLTQPALGAAPSAQLCRFYRMTPAEARLAELIVRGSSLGQAGAALHITKNTARTHMKHIYAKTDTRSAADLVRLFGGVNGVALERPAAARGRPAVQ